MPAHFHPPTLKRIGRLKGLAITLLGVVVLASAGVPTLAVAAAFDLAASPAPSASDAPSASPAPSASGPRAASPSPSPEPSAPASPEPSVALSPISTPSSTPPPGAVAVATLKGQPYQLPAFVGLGAWQASRVSFYGPGFYCVSNRVKACLPQRGRSARAKLTACGVLFTRTVVGVAHRTLPCGSLVAFTYRGRTVIAPVIDRGPYVAGRVWDLSGGLCVALRHCFTGPINWTTVHRAIGPAAPVRINLRRL
jgi:rare lipoprotein A (peptidoglycan hydrolase)